MLSLLIVMISKSKEHIALEATDQETFKSFIFRGCLHYGRSIQSSKELLGYSAKYPAVIHEPLTRMILSRSSIDAER